MPHSQLQFVGLYVLSPDILHVWIVDQGQRRPHTQLFCLGAMTPSKATPLLGSSYEDTT